MTIARNAADEEYATGVGGVFFDDGTFTSRGSLIAHNVRADGSTENCGQALSSSGGNNLESGSECGFTGSGDRVNAAPDLADGARRPRRRDRRAGVRRRERRTRHRRNVLAHRPDRRACGRRGSAATPAPGSTRTVATQPPPPPAPTPAPVATPVATPVAGKSVEAEPVSGKVLVKLPGSKGFVELDPSVIPNGSEVDTRDGVVEISRADGGTAKFYDGIFKLSQANGVTTATLSEKLDCSPASKKARAAVKKAKKTKTRKLWGEGKGKFRTRGQYSAATIRGTKWFLQDTCTSTITKVKEGVVEVRDEVKKKTIVLRKGKTLHGPTQA